MKRLNWLLSPAVLLAIVVVSAPVSAATYFVRSGGDDRADGLTAGTAFKSIVRAAQVFNHGDQLVIGPGTYREAAVFAERFGTAENRITITGDESGKLTGDAAGAVIVEPGSALEPALCFYRYRSLTLSGLTLRGAGPGIKLDKCLDVVIERSTFDGLSTGLLVQGVNGLQVESTVFCRCLTGIALRATSNVRLDHLTVARNSFAGILITSCGPGSIRNSIFTQNVTMFSADETSAPNWTSDYNALHGGTGCWGTMTGIALAYQWPASSGQDWHSLYMVPVFAGPEKFDLHISPLVTWPGGLAGMNVGRPDRKDVLDRDGKAFAVRGGAVAVGAYDYPEPQGAPGWQKMSVRMEGAAPRQSAGIYKEDGTLVRMLLMNTTGVRDLWWDGLDDMGQPAEPARYEVRSITHDVRLMDEGNVGNNGNPAGFFNALGNICAAALPEGGFMLYTLSEYGQAIKHYASSGNAVSASFTFQMDYWGLAAAGDDVIGGYTRGGKGETAGLVRLNRSGVRAPMADGAEDYPIFAAGEPNGVPTALAVVGGRAYVSIPSLNIVRCIDLKTGKPQGDWLVPGIGGLAVDEQGRFWALVSGEIASLDPASGQVGKHYPSGLKAAVAITAGHGKVAALDKQNSQVTVLDADSGKVLRTWGHERLIPAGGWQLSGPEYLRDSQGLALLADGELLVLESLRVRVLSPETGKVDYEQASQYGYAYVVNPTHPEYLYNSFGIYKCDPKTGAWEWVVDMPSASPKLYSDEDTKKLIGRFTGAAVLDKRPFVMCTGYGEKNYTDKKGNSRYNTTVVLLDVSDPLKPRTALIHDPNNAQAPFFCFGKDGDLVKRAEYNSPAFTSYKFKGLDADHNPIYDFDHPVTVGSKIDPVPNRKLYLTNGGEYRPAVDVKNGDIYNVALTAQYPPTVAYFRGGSGMTKSNAAGQILWYVKGWDSFYMNQECLNDGKNTWVAGVDWLLGGPDIYDGDGLWITSGNLGWTSAHTGGMMDESLDGLLGYVRPDGKPGFYLEDDGAGRAMRLRLDGAETLVRQKTAFDWKTPGQPGTAGSPPLAYAAAGPLLPYMVIPKVAPLKLDGDWTAFRKAGGSAQILNLPCNASFNRGMPENLMLTLADCTSIGGLVHDGNSFYVYFLVADATLIMDATSSGMLWAGDGVEFYLEQEQFTMGLMKGGIPDLHKHRQHDRDKKDYAGRYQMPSEDIWAKAVDDLGAHPLGRELETMTGISMKGKKGYAVMARIPFEEVKLVTGDGHKNGINDMTGQPGEMVRVIMVQACIFNPGEYQAAKISWPPSQMYFDAHRSVPMVLGQ